MAENIKEEIREQLSKLAEKKSLDKITVKELVGACNISRQTFYYYYRDILDVIEDSIRVSLNQCVRKCAMMDDEYECIHEFVSEIADHMPLIAHLLDSKLRAEVEDMFFHGIREMISRMVEDKDEIEMKHEERQFLIDFFSCAVTGIIISHCHDVNPDPEWFSRVFYQVLEKIKY